MNEYSISDIINYYKNKIRFSEQWKDVNVDVGIAEMFINILSYATQLNVSVFNSMFNDMFPHLTMSDRVLLDFCEFIDYKVNRARSAKGKVMFYIDNTIDKDIIIYPRTVLRGINDKYYNTINADIVRFGKDYTSTVVDVIEGEFKEVRVVADGSSYFKVYIYEEIDNDNVEVYVNNDKYEEVNTFLFSTNVDKHYIVRRMKDGWYIMFSDGIFGMKPFVGDEIKIKYLVSSGKAGNIPASGINEIVSVVYYDDNSICDNIKVKVINEDNIFNGMDAEDLDSIRKNISRYLSSVNYLISASDYRNYLLSNSLIIDCLVKPGWEVYRNEEIIPSVYDVIKVDGIYATFDGNINSLVIEVNGDGVGANFKIDNDCISPVGAGQYAVNKVKVVSGGSGYRRCEVIVRNSNNEICYKGIGMLYSIPVSQFYNTVFIYVVGNTSGYLLSDDDKKVVYEYLKARDIFFVDLKIVDINLVGIYLDVSLVLSSKNVSYSKYEKVREGVIKQLEKYFSISKDIVLSGGSIFKDIYKGELIHIIMDNVDGLNNVFIDMYVVQNVCVLNFGRYNYVFPLLFNSDELVLNRVELLLDGKKYGDFVLDGDILRYSDDYLFMEVNMDELYVNIVINDNISSEDFKNLFANKKVALKFYVDEQIKRNRDDIIFYLYNYSIINV